MPVGHYLAPLCAYAGHADCIAPFHLGKYEIWRPLYEPPVAGLYGYHAMLAGYVAQKGRGICGGEVDYGEYLALVDLDIIVQYGGYLQRIEYVHVFGDKLIFAYEPFRFAVGLKLGQSHIVRLFIGVYGLGRVHAGSLVRSEGYGAVQKAVCPLIVAGGYFR